MFTPRVLISEPDAATAASLKRQFTASGWEVMTAGSAAEVIAFSAMHRPDIVLLDATVGGVDLLERMRAQPVTREILVAMMSIDCGADQRARCIAAGAFAFLSKPLRLASVLALKKVVQGRHAAPRVLISDDDELITRSLERAARHEGLEPVAENDAAQVVGLAKELHPEVIVLDINQRSLDGRDVLARLKSDPDTRHIRVVMLTGVEDQLTRHDCLILGADDYVVKPLDPLFFVHIARKIAEQNFELISRP